MKKLLILLIIPLILYSSCDTRMDANLFSGLKNIDNISVLEAIASGDEDIMTAVYEREKNRLQTLDSVYNREDFLKTTLDIADLQSVRSRGVLLFLTLIASNVNQSEIETVIDAQIIEDFLYEVTERVRDVYVLRGEATGVQKFMALLGLIVYWYYIAEVLGTTPAEMIQAFKAGQLATLLSDAAWEDLEDYNNVNEIEVDFSEAIIEMEQYAVDIENDPELEKNPDLDQALQNTQSSFGIGG